MNYEKALQLWGAKKVAEMYMIEASVIDLSSVRVDFDFNEGFACCGGRDPSCYCSFAESPSADVVIYASSIDGNFFQKSIDVESFDFLTVLKELISVGDGTITS